MVARRTTLAPVSSRELGTAALAALAVALTAFAGMHELGLAGLGVPLLLAILLILLLRHPLALTVSVVGLVIVAEGPTFGILSFASHLYDRATALNVLVALAVASVGIDMMRHHRPLRIDRPLLPLVVMLALGMVVGGITGHANGIGLSTVIHNENVLAYLLLLPLAVANLDVDRATLRRVLAGAMALAIVKAILGLVEVVGHLGLAIEGTASLTYYEPTANWLIMISLLSVCAALCAKVRLPQWILLCSPLLLASLILSYRRSFWIALALGVVLVVLLGLSSAGRKLLVPTLAVVGVAIWLMGSVSVQSQSPVVKRFESLSPTGLENNVQASYRLDERTNVLHAISEHPLTGLGIRVPWSATVRPLSVEHEEGRQYVHFAVLWFWLKLGILGMVAYVSFISGALVLSWQVWRLSPEPAIRAFGLASLAGWLGLVAIEATASFTGVDPRFTVLVSAQVGVLALLARRAPGERSETAGIV